MLCNIIMPGKSRKLFKFCKNGWKHRIYPHISGPAYMYHNYYAERNIIMPATPCKSVEDLNYLNSHKWITRRELDWVDSNKSKNVDVKYRPWRADHASVWHIFPFGSSLRSNAWGIYILWKASKIIGCRVRGDSGWSSSKPWPKYKMKKWHAFGSKRPVKTLSSPSKSSFNQNPNWPKDHENPSQISEIPPHIFKNITIFFKINGSR